jgi:hypothetical protein
MVSELEMVSEVETAFGMRSESKLTGHLCLVEIHVV